MTVDKGRILSEIKRLASANGGKPPGRERFEKDTGIAVSDWYPHLWLRWGDAVAEAGFLPNTLSSRLDPDVLLEKYISFARELGRPPLHAEIRLKAKTDSDFPGHTTFSRLGDKAALLAAARAYCEKHPQHSDLISLFPSAADSISTKDATSSRKIETGFVYLMKSGRHFKIGRTNALGRREWELGIKIPIPPTTVHSIETDDPVGVEAYWHKRFAAKRGEGEWFVLSPEDVAAFKRWKKLA